MKSESDDNLKMENSAEKGSRSLQYACALSGKFIFFM